MATVAISRTADPAGASASGNVASYSAQSIGVEAADRIVCLVVTSELASASPDSATINYGTGAVSMTAGSLGNFGAVYARAFYAPAPTGTTADFTVTFGANPDNTQNHVSVYRVVGARPAPTAGNNGSTDMDATTPLTTGSITIATNGGFLAVAAGATSSTTSKTWSNATEDLEVSGGGFCHTTATRTTSGTVTITCTGSNNNEDGAMSWLIFTPGTLVAANSASYAITGAAATVKRGFKVAADAGSYTITGTAAGLEPVPAATQENLWPNSEVMPFDAADSLNVTLTSNAVLAPNGTTTAELLTESTDGGATTHRFGEFSLALADQITITPGQWYTFSFYAKAVTGTRNILLEFYSSSGNNTFSIALDTTTGAVDVSASEGLIGNFKLPFSASAANGFWRVGVSLYFPSSFTGGWGIGGWGQGTWGDERTASIDPIVFDAVYGEIRSGTSASYTGNGSTVAFWGFQVNRGGRPATYSKTPSSGKTIAADAGSYTATGTSASLEYGREVLALAGSYAITGTAAALKFGRKTAANTGSYAVSGTDASLELGREVLALGGSYSFTGTSASLNYNRVVIAASGAYSITGTAANLRHGRLATAGSESYAINGTGVTLRKGLTVAAGAGSYAVTGTAATLRHSWAAAAGAGSYSVSGTAAALRHGWVVTAAAGSYALSGAAAILETGENLRPDGDVSDGGWTTNTGGNDLWTAIDEVSPDDGDYIRSADDPSGDACEVTVTNPSAGVGESVTVEYRYCKFGSGQIDLTVSLKEGSTTIASWTHTDIGTPEITARQSLSSGEVSSITDYAALSLRFEATKV